MEATDPVIELPRESRQLLGWDSKQRIDLMPSQVESELETCTRRVSEEVSPEAGVREQPTQGSFDVPLAHASSPGQGSHQAAASVLARLCGAPSHGHV
jgi:hypothetical protein